VKNEKIEIDKTSDRAKSETRKKDTLSTPPEKNTRKQEHGKAKNSNLYRNYQMMKNTPEKVIF